MRRLTSPASTAAWLKRREQAQARERHRHDHVRIGEELRAGLDEPATEQAARIVTVVVLEIVDEPAHDAVVLRDGASPAHGGGCRRRGRDHAPPVS